MTKDIVGNDVKVGDLVVVDKILDKLPDPILGEIIAIHEAGILPPNSPKNAIAAGTVTIRIQFTAPYDPTKPLGLVKVVRPPEQPTN